MKKILVPVDFSDTSLNALNIACQVAVRSGASVYMLHVNELSPAAVPMSEYAYVNTVDDAAYEAEVEGRLDALRLELLAEPEFASLKIESEVREGLILPSIRDVSDRQGIDLIVMGTLGVSGVKEMLVGSNTERVIRYAECPVLVVPHGITDWKVEKVLVPSTFKNDQEPLFNIVKAWKEAFGFKVEAVYLNNPLNAPTDGTIEAEKNRMMERVGLKDVFVYIFGDTMYEDNAIIAQANQAESDLIIMGTHQRRGLSHLLFGSLTEDTANHTHIPVLAVPIK